MLAHGHPAGGDQEIGPRRALDQDLEARHVVRGDAQIDRLPAARGHESGERDAVGADDLVGPQRIARHDHLVAGGEHGDAWAPVDLEPRLVHGRGQAHIARGEQPPGGHTHFACAEVEARGAHVAAGGRAFLDDDMIAVGFRVLLDDDGIGALGQGAAGEDTHRLARLHGAVVRGPGGRPADHRKAHGHARHIGRAHRVAVHGGDVLGWLGDPGGHVLGEHPAERLGQTHGLGRQGPERRRDAGQRFLDGEHVRLPRTCPTCRPTCASGGYPRCACRGRPPCTCHRR